MKINRLSAAIFGVMVVAALAGAAAQITKEQVEQLKRPGAGQREIPPDRLRPSFDSGATHWISPLLENAPGTIGGEHFTIDGKRLSRWFELSVINPNADRSVNAYIGCYDAGGAMLARYNTTLPVPPSGAAGWSTLDVTPPPTTDGASQDIDKIWCVIAGEAPIVVFGWTIRRFGSDEGRYHFSLERVAPR